jgi:hypothetical protein
LLPECNSSQPQREPFALDSFSSKNINVAQIFGRPNHAGSACFPD